MPPCPPRVVTCTLKSPIPVAINSKRAVRSNVPPPPSGKKRCQESSASILTGLHLLNVQNSLRMNPLY